MAVQPGLCRTWSETSKTDFLVTWFELSTCGWTLGLVSFSALWFHPFSTNKVAKTSLMVIQPCLHKYINKHQLRGVFDVNSRIKVKVAHSLVAIGAMGLEPHHVLGYCILKMVSNPFLSPPEPSPKIVRYPFIAGMNCNKILYCGFSLESL